MWGSKKRGQDRQGGQSTVEFMLMVPLIFAMFFFVIEMGLYFSAVHYANYGTYVAARCRQTGYYGVNAPPGEEAKEIASLVLTGSVFFKNYQVRDTQQKGVTVQMQSWTTNFPFLRALLPNMAFSTTVNLGTNESMYEADAAIKRAEQGYSPNCTDSDVGSTGC